MPLYSATQTWQNKLPKPFATVTVFAPAMQLGTYQMSPHMVDESENPTAFIQVFPAVSVTLVIAW